VKSFARLAHGDRASVLVVNHQVPVASAAELVAYAKANPGKLAYGSAGTAARPTSRRMYFKLITGTTS